MAKQAIASDMDIARLLKRVREAFRSMKVAEHQEVSARNVAAARRLELGRALTEARERWPRSGPNAKGWGEFLAAAGINDDVALDAIKYAKVVSERFAGKKQIEPGKLPTLREAGIVRDALTEKRDEDEPKVDRGAWCTPAPIAVAVGPWDLDPFSNPRSHIVSTERCMLEDGGDGFGDRSTPGSYRPGGHPERIARAKTRVWLQPDYGYVLEAVHHYCHTRFCALLRLDPSTEWFDYLHARSQLILIPKGDRIEFDPPEGVEASSNPYPHGLFYAQAKDVTEEIRALCYEWRIRAA